MEGFTDVANLVMLSIVPYVLASQGTMLGGRTGLFSVSQEGIMLLGASVGFLGAYLNGGLVYGMLIALLAGAVAGFMLAYLTTALKMNQFVIGLAIFLFTLGLSNLVYKLIIGVTLSPPLIPTLPRLPIPILSDIPVLGEILFDQNILVYFAVILSLALHWILNMTSFGLKLRSTGENPKAADSLGVNVNRMRYLTATIGGMLMALAGAYLPMVYTGTFTAGIVHGRGWIAIALTFFGGWTPLLILLGAFFFSGIDVLALRAQVGGFDIPYQYLLMLPYVATILAMIFATRWVKAPAFLAQNYDRERRSQS